jgi:hypothetical protein
MPQPSDVCDGNFGGTQGASKVYHNGAGGSDGLSEAEFVSGVGDLFAVHGSVVITKALTVRVVGTESSGGQSYRT